MNVGVMLKAVIASNTEHPLLSLCGTIALRACDVWNKCALPDARRPICIQYSEHIIQAGEYCELMLSCRLSPLHNASMI